MKDEKITDKIQKKPFRARLLKRVAFLYSKQKFRAKSPKILAYVTNRYLHNNKFNGVIVHEIQEQFSLSFEEVITIASELVRLKKITIEFADRHPNGYIKAYQAESLEIQLQKLSVSDYFWLYPSPEHLEIVVDKNEFADQPFILALALGSAQLDLIPFESSVLETYVNDPRYEFDMSGFSGSISISTEFYESVEEQDRIFLKSFCYAQNEEHHSGIAVLLCYLSKLSPEHQQIWSARGLTGKWMAHPLYLARMLGGSWKRELSIYDAIIEEMEEINKLCSLIGRPPFFRDGFKGKKRPKKFGLMLRPTTREYDEQAHIVDKMLSENINFNFITNDISRNREVERSDGKIVVQAKGSLTLFEEWIDKYYHGPDGEKYGHDLLESLKAVRKERQRPAHTLSEDEYDWELLSRHRTMIESIYDSLSTLRLIFAKHPRAKDYVSPEYLERGRVHHV